MRTFSTICASHLALLKAPRPQLFQRVYRLSCIGWPSQFPVHFSKKNCKNGVFDCCHQHPLLSFWISLYPAGLVWCMKQMADFHNKWHHKTKQNNARHAVDSWFAQRWIGKQSLKIIDSELSHCFNDWSAGGWGLLSSPWCWSSCSQDGKTIK